MEFSLEKAGIGKRISAFLFDFIIFSVIATGLAFLVSVITDYDSHSNRLGEIYEKYEKEYGISFQLSADELAAMTEDELAAYREKYAAAETAVSGDPEASREFSTVADLSLIITSVSLFIATLLSEFILPLLLGNGQTLGKKIFSIGVIRPDGVRLSRIQLFTRAILGKYAVETMIPVLLILLFYFRGMNALITFAPVAAIAIAQLIFFCAGGRRALIHDVLAGSVAVDMQTQIIYADEEEKEKSVDS